jgi:hypothetical protein
VRLAVVFGLALLALAAPQAAGAQIYCASGPSSPSGYTSYVPTGYSHYSGFASFPGAMTSGALPSGYSTNPYTGCAPTTAASNANPYDPNASAASSPTYSGVYASNVYNPYSGWGLTNTASYPFASYGNSGSTAATNYGYGGLSPYGNFAGFPGMAPSGYLAGTSSSATTYNFNSNTASTPAAPSSYGGYTPTASPFSTSNAPSYYNAGGVPIYYGGANASSTAAGTSASYSGFGTTAGYGNGYSAVGTSAGNGGGYYTYGNGASTAAPYSGVSTMITYGCGGTC